MNLATGSSPTGWTTNAQLPTRVHNMVLPAATDGIPIEPLVVSLEAPSYIRLSAMSVQLRINSLQDRKLNVRTSARHVLRSVRVPESPGAPGPACEAIQADGRPCKVALASSAQDPWCHRHHSEWIDLNTRWNKANKDAEKVTVVSSETAKQKVIKLRLSVDLRRQIRDRFYPRGGDMQDYIKWLAKLETDVRQLADNLLSMHSLSYASSFRLYLTAIHSAEPQSRTYPRNSSRWHAAPQLVRS